MQGASCEIYLSVLKYNRSKQFIFSQQYTVPEIPGHGVTMHYLQLPCSQIEKEKSKSHKALGEYFYTDQQKVGRNCFAVKPAKNTEAKQN